MPMACSNMCWAVRSERKSTPARVGGSQNTASPIQLLSEKGYIELYTEGPLTLPEPCWEPERQPTLHRRAATPPHAVPGLRRLQSA